MSISGGYKNTVFRGKQYHFPSKVDYSFSGEESIFVHWTTSECLNHHNRKVNDGLGSPDMAFGVDFPGGHLGPVTHTQRCVMFGFIRTLSVSCRYRPASPSLISY